MFTDELKAIQTVVRIFSDDKRAGKTFRIIDEFINHTGRITPSEYRQALGQAVATLEHHINQMELAKKYFIELYL